MSSPTSTSWMTMHRPVDISLQRQSLRAQQLRNSLNDIEMDLNNPDDELADVFMCTALSTPEAQWQSKSASGDSDAVSKEMPENCEIQEGTALDNGDEGSSVRHVEHRESRLRVIYRSLNGVHSVRQGGDNRKDSELDLENGSWDWYYEQRAAHEKNSKGDESDDDSGSGESIYISLAC
ncbi:hypothetical protein B0H14DRAFT_2596823 [Mycena olivaceomarginata]|nr:hypothetical protein B0H14DRAFT_2596823 [Mycena olivaceomarginata]